MGQVVGDEVALSDEGEEVVGILRIDGGFAASARAFLDLCFAGAAGAGDDIARRSHEVIRGFDVEVILRIVVGEFAGDLLHRDADRRSFQGTRDVDLALAVKIEVRAIGSAVLIHHDGTLHAGVLGVFVGKDGAAVAHRGVVGVFAAVDGEVGAAIHRDRATVVLLSLVLEEDGAVKGGRAAF